MLFASLADLFNLYALFSLVNFGRDSIAIACNLSTKMWITLDNLFTNCSFSPSFLLCLHSTCRICEDLSLSHVAYWDENNYVCIPSMESLRLELNMLGMTANHTDSLQKNFNDYQFKRQTDQRRIRHTSEQGIVKFSNSNFIPGAKELLGKVLRKSAMKKLQGGSGSSGSSNTQQDKANRNGNGSGVTRRRSRVSSVRNVSGGAQRNSKQSEATSSNSALGLDRMNPYVRYGGPAPLHDGSANQHQHMTSAGLPMPLSTPLGHFAVSAQPGSVIPGSGAMQPMFHSSDGDSVGHNMMVPFGMHAMGFSMATNHTDSSSAIENTTAAFTNAPLYMDGTVPGLMIPPHFVPAASQVSLPTSAYNSHYHHQQQQYTMPSNQNGCSGGNDAELGSLQNSVSAADTHAHDRQASGHYHTPASSQYSSPLSQTAGGASVLQQQQQQQYHLIAGSGTSGLKSNMPLSAANEAENSNVYYV